MGTAVGQEAGAFVQVMAVAVGVGSIGGLAMIGLGIRVAVTGRHD
jgi:hypothetical protein